MADELQTRKVVLLPLLIGLFFILGYDGLHHWDEPYYLSTAAFEAPAKWGVFYMFKYGHLLILKGLIEITGIGLKGLFIISLVYALMILGFIFCTFFLLKEIINNEALPVTFTLMFLPATLYLSFKALAEVPSLLFGTLSLLLFMYALKNSGIRSFLFILSSAFFLFLSILCRFESPIMFLSFFIALLLVYHKEYGVKKLIASFSLLSVLSFIFIVTAIAITKMDLSFMLTTFFAFQDEARYTIFENFLMFFLLGGLLYPFAFFSILNRGNEFKFAFIWFILAVSFTLFLMDHLEVRRLCWSLIPLSVLVFLGINGVFKRLKEKKIEPRVSKMLFVILLSVILLGNHFLVAAGPDKIDEIAYKRMFDKIEGSYENRTLLVSSSYDYSFIQFAFPVEDVFYVRGENEQDKVMRSLYQDKTVLYITWTISRDLLVYKYERSDYNESWVAKDQRITLTKIIAEGRYCVYLLHLKNGGFGDGDD